MKKVNLGNCPAAVKTAVQLWVQLLEALGKRRVILVS
jgi:hypothetical protein